VTPAQLAAALAKRVDTVAPALLPAARRSGGYWSAGSVEGERGGSLYIHRTGARAGKWCDAATDQHGDLLDLVQLVKRVDLHGACDWARDFVGITEPRSNKARTDDDERGELDARQIWRGSEDARGTRAETYFQARRIMVEAPPSVRFHGALGYRPSGLILPAVVCAVSGPDRRVHAVQRIYLTLDGSDKAGVAQPKMTRGPMRDGAVRLAPAARELGLAEGPETALSAMQLHGIPTWAALGRRMDAVAIPETVERLVIFADNGEPGQLAAEKAAEAHRRPSRTVEIIYPAPEFKDFNDVLTGKKRAA
jgi:Toprim domain